jgi:hypothetical protein
MLHFLGLALRYKGAESTRKQKIVSRALEQPDDVRDESATKRTETKHSAWIRPGSPFAIALLP